MARSLTEPARELRAKHFVDKITDIADDGRNDFMRRATERGEEFVAVVRARAYCRPNSAGPDGRLDLAHATIAERALCHVATVKRALARLQELGLVDWVRRLVRGPAPAGGLSRPATPTCCGRHPAKR